jgi:hypothetical protein
LGWFYGLGQLAQPQGKQEEFVSTACTYARGAGQWPAPLASRLRPVLEKIPHTSSKFTIQSCIPWSAALSPQSSPKE